MSALSMLVHFTVGCLIGYVMSRLIPNKAESLLWTFIGCVLYALTFGRMLP